MPHVPLKLDQQVTAYHLACYGMGIAFVTDTLIRHAPDDSRIVFYKLPPDISQRNIYFYHKRSRYVTRAMEEFLKIAGSGILTQAALYSITHAGLTSEFISMPAINIMGFRFNTTVSGNESTAMWEQFERQIPAGLLTALHKADIKLNGLYQGFHRNSFIVSMDHTPLLF